MVWGSNIFTSLNESHKAPELGFLYRFQAQRFAYAHNVRFMDIFEVVDLTYAQRIGYARGLRAQVESCEQADHVTIHRETLRPILARRPRTCLLLQVPRILPVSRVPCGHWIKQRGRRSNVGTWENKMGLGLSRQAFKKWHN